MSTLLSVDHWSTRDQWLTCCLNHSSSIHLLLFLHLPPQVWWWCTVHRVLIGGGVWWMPPSRQTALARSWSSSWKEIEADVDSNNNKLVSSFGLSLFEPLYLLPVWQSRLEKTTWVMLGCKHIEICLDGFIKRQSQLSEQHLYGRSQLTSTVVYAVLNAMLSNQLIFNY